MRFDADRIAEIKKSEERRFLEAPISMIAVKSSPWSTNAVRFGLVRRPRNSGPVTVMENNGTRHEYASLSDMLDEWIGD